MNYQVIYGQLVSIYMIALTISVEDAEGIVAEIDRTASLMPVVDPSSWMKIASTFPDHERLARAFLAFRREIEAIKPRT